MYNAEAVEAVRDEPIALQEKGFGRTTTAREIAVARPSVFGGEFVFPVMTLRASAIESNLAAMARYCADQGVELAPHGKTTMAPTLFGRQLDSGCWGMTAATIGHVQIYQQFGIQRILLANELADPAGIAWLASELATDPDFDFYCYVDSTAGIELLDQGMRGAGRRLKVLVEIGHDGGRTGVRDDAVAVEIAATATKTETLQVAGVAGYEGGLGPGRSPEVLDRIGAFCDRIVSVGQQIRDLVDGPLVLSAGGSAYPDVVAAHLGAATDWATVVLRSGCYITHDDGIYAEVSPFIGPPYQLTAAFELWAHVVSRPEPGLVLTSIGRRDVAFDAGMPIPQRIRYADGTIVNADGLTVSGLNDQHGYVVVPTESKLAPGDAISFGISHPCTTFDKWRHILLVDDDDRVVDVIRTYF